MPFLANISDASLIFQISPWYVRLLVSIFLVQFLYLQIWIWLDAIKAHTGNLTSAALQNCLSSDAESASIIHEMELKRAHFFCYSFQFNGIHFEFSFKTLTVSSQPKYRSHFLIFVVILHYKFSKKFSQIYHSSM